MTLDASRLKEEMDDRVNFEDYYGHIEQSPPRRDIYSSLTLLSAAKTEEQLKE